MMALPGHELSNGLLDGLVTPASSREELEEHTAGMADAWCSLGRLFRFQYTQRVKKSVLLSRSCLQRSQQCLEDARPVLNRRIDLITVDATGPVASSWRSPSIFAPNWTYPVDTWSVPVS
jgi:hypothetical protein